MQEEILLVNNPEDCRFPLDEAGHAVITLRAKSRLFRLASSDKANLETQKSGFQTQKSAFQAEKSGFQAQKSGFQTQKSVFQAEKSGFQVEKSGFQAQKFPFQAEKSGFQAPKSGFQAAKFFQSRVSNLVDTMILDKHTVLLSLENGFIVTSRKLVK